MEAPKLYKPFGETKLGKHNTIAKLVLEDGSVFEGFSFGYESSVSGEVVFNTAMCGYPESLTDPSYEGQILTFTFPMIGNYGVPSFDEVDEYGIPKFFESDKIHVSGVIVSDYSWEYSHWNAKRSLSDWLKSSHVPALYGIDTRMLTKKIREHGVMLGKIEFEHEHVDIFDPNLNNLVEQVSTKEIKVYNKGGYPRILAYDCGMKYNIIRCFLERGVQLTVVPFNYDIKQAEDTYDGLFISNGPGDPMMCKDTIESLKYAISRDQPKPIFGICLGNQLLALAAGARTEKMPFGNRACNVPCVDLSSARCYITSQNHGFQVVASSLPEGWAPLFFNVNDSTNEGIFHKSKPFFSSQFHPEACAGPIDTRFLFDRFLDMIKGIHTPANTFNVNFFKPPQFKKVLILGSGGLSIGQAGEFDYSGSQAIKALKEEHMEVILMNPNIATVQTGKGLASKVYFLPVTFDFVCKVIEKERPNAILVSMGGQTALNVGIELYQSKTLEKYNIQVLGTPIQTVIDTEDRELFKEKLIEINEKLALSAPALTLDEALEVAHRIGYPVLIRSAFALGGLGSGFAKDDESLLDLAQKAFSGSKQILIDKDLRGWKEIEYEVVRDSFDNCITVCNMENFDPLGIHTGDSIVVAPSQTLTNSEYMKLRDTAIRVVRHLGIIGECNVQYALNPESEDYCIIEVNARLSRSSALASKATGYPLAYVAAKLALGKNLIQIQNSITHTTSACFEPSLDYCVVKVPRWDLKKFHKVSPTLGSCMKSVGEVMAIGRNFEEAIQKALRMVNPLVNGFEAPKNDIKELLHHLLTEPDDRRIYAIAYGLMNGMTVQEIHDLTKIDKWFLNKLNNIANATMLIQNKHLTEIDRDSMKILKVLGFADKQIATHVHFDNIDNPKHLKEELLVREYRKSLNVLPVVKQVDTLAAEFPAHTNYLYLTYSGYENDVEFDDHGIIVLGCGPYSIGSSVEFDYAAVSCVRALRSAQKNTIIINFNPETVSTDYDECDRLYFEELSLERVLDIYELEQSEGVIVSVGGQIANNLALPLCKYGVNIFGTSPYMIEKAEDRSQFSNMLDELKIDQPAWVSVTSNEKALEFGRSAPYPVLVRPSFVLSGAAMSVAYDENSLIKCLSRAAEISSDYPVVLSKYFEGAKEIEFDAVAEEGEILNYAISEHVENAGVHSGDATLLLPSQRLYSETERRVKIIASKIAAKLRISGPFNIQMLAKNNAIKIIECNLRASRTFPFMSKTFDFNFIELATRVMVHLPHRRGSIVLKDLNYVCCKAPMFSFTRLQGADPTLGVEMASTGEVACYGNDPSEAFIKALLSTNFKFTFPKFGSKEGRNILVSIPPKEFDQFKESIEFLIQHNCVIYATEGTYARLEQMNLPANQIVLVHKNSTQHKDHLAIDALKNNQIHVAIIVPNGNSDAITDGYKMRRCAVDFSVPLITNVKCAIEFALEPDFLKILSIEEYYEQNKENY
ncbi:hypothetical protein WA158_005981 [Blastocystis sp. Blastoise]